MHILERGKMLKYPYGVSTHGYLTHNHRKLRFMLAKPKQKPIICAVQTRERSDQSLPPQCEVFNFFAQFEKLGFEDLEI